MRMGTQLGLKFNRHGVVGLLLIILMFGIAYAWNWSINWVYFVAAIVLYAGAIIFLTIRQTNLEGRDYIDLHHLDGVYYIDTLRLLFSCHCALIFLALGLWLHFSDGRVNAAFFLASTAVGLAIPFSLFTIKTKNAVEEGHAINRTSGKFNPYGILGGVAIILMFGFAFRWQWNINWVYFLGATILYSIAVIILALNYEDRSFGYGDFQPSLTIFRLLLGCHLALLFLAVGLFLHFKDNGANFAFFLAGTAAGVALPFLLIRAAGPGLGAGPGLSENHNSDTIREPE